MILVQRILTKDEMIKQVRNKCELIQKEVKEIYTLLKSLLEKGLPPFWDPENKLLRKRDYSELFVQRRNGHSKFDDLEGSLKGETIVVKLGDLFDLLNIIRRIKFPKPLIEEYLNLELEADQMYEIAMPTRVFFKELARMVVPLVGVIPLTIGLDDAQTS
jgi:hypothetical protein